MRINVAIPEAHVDAPVLNAALESVTRLNERLLGAGAPTFRQALPTGIRWKPEPPGAEHFDHALTVLGRKWGDCDDLAPWHAASLRATGEDPGARAIVKKSGPQRWHAVVRRSDGQIDDPSKEAGMLQYRGVVGAALPVMPQQHSVVGSGVGAYVLTRPSIAIRPVGRAWQARADIPWLYAERKAAKAPTERDVAMAALHAAPAAATALTGAIDGITELACCSGFADPEHVRRLQAVADAIEGADYDELAGVYGDEHAEEAMRAVVGFFGGLKKLAKKALRAVPFASKVVQFVPGVGPIASTALDVAAHAASQSGRPRPRPAPQYAASPYAGQQPLNLRCVPFT